MRRFFGNLFGHEKTRKIVPNQDILHERVRYEKGKVYQVDIQLARYFDRNGWIEGEFKDFPEATSVLLEVQDGKLGHEGKS